MCRFRIFTEDAPLAYSVLRMTLFSALWRGKIAHTAPKLVAKLSFFKLYFICL